MKWVSAFILLLSLLVSGKAQQKDIEIFEKKEGNTNIVVARNIGKVSYQVTLVVNAKGMDVIPGYTVEAIIPAGYMKEMVRITPRPGESWSYGYDVSFTESSAQASKSITPNQPDQVASNTAKTSSETTTPKVPVPPPTLSTAPIIVYTQAGCGRCSFVKKEMNAKGIAFEEVDVNSTSPEVNHMWKQLREGGFTDDSLTMPVVKVNGQLHYNIKDLAGFVNGIK